MNPKPLIDPGLFANLAGFYPSLATIQSVTSSRNTYKEEVLTPSTLHANVPCAVASAGGKEVKRADMTYAIGTHKVALAGYYPDVTETMRVQVVGLTLNILLVEHDSHQKSTRLLCEVVR